MKSKTAYPPVLILGCGRSGTSIFGELFGSLSGYEYLSEPPFSEVISRIDEGVAIKVPTESVGFASDPGLSFPFKTLLEVSPTTRVFWIVRHPLDAICSLRIGIGQDWMHHPRPLDWQEWLDRPLIERCAHHWNYINSFGYDAVRDLATLVRFEDMIEAPLQFAEAAVIAGGSDPLDHQRSIKQWAARVQDTNNEQFIEAHTSRRHSRPDHSVRVGRWQENLSAQEVSVVVSMVSKTNERYGYDLDSSLC